MDKIGDYTLVGKNLDRLRKKSGMTSQVIARKAGLGVGYISEIIYGRYRSVTVTTLEKLAKVLDCDIREFFRPEDEWGEE